MKSFSIYEVGLVSDGACILMNVPSTQPKKTCLKNSYHLCLTLTKKLEVIYFNLGGKLNYYFLVNVMCSSEFHNKNMRILYTQ